MADVIVLPRAPRITREYSMRADLAVEGVQVRHVLALVPRDWFALPAWLRHAHMAGKVLFTEWYVVLDQERIGVDDWLVFNPTTSRIHHLPGELFHVLFEHADRDIRFYCPTCGTLYVDGVDVIVCSSCGGRDIRPCTHRPERITCVIAGCAWTGWDDGCFIYALDRHLQGIHPCPPTPPALTTRATTGTSR